jgi:hypothetical protein
MTVFVRRTVAGFALTLAGMTGAQAETDMMLILDASNSMWGQIDGVHKIETARSVLNELLADTGEGSRVGLMAYGHRSEGACDDIEVISPIGAGTPQTLTDALAAIKPKGKTPIAAALKAAGGTFASNDANNNVILISDGIETCSGDPCAVAGELASAGIGARVHVVGFDVDEAARAQLQCIADAGNGKYFNARNAGELKVAVAEVKEVAEALPVPEPEPEPAASIVFEDEFDGGDLAEHWQVKNPNPDAFIVEDGKLLVVTGAASGFGVPETPNLMLLDQALPDGDWELSATVSAEYQTAVDSIWIGLYKDDQNYIAARLYAAGDKYYGWSLNLQAIKAAGGEIANFDTRVSSLGCNVCGADRMFPNFAATITMPMKLSLVKQGRKFFARLAVAGEVDEAGGQVVHETEAVSSLRLPGGPALTAAQDKQTSGETLFYVDRVEIVALE